MFSTCSMELHYSSSSFCIMSALIFVYSLRFFLQIALVLIVLVLVNLID